MKAQDAKKMFDHKVPPIELDLEQRLVFTDLHNDFPIPRSARPMAC